MNRQDTNHANPETLNECIDAVLAQTEDRAQSESAQRKLIARLDAEKPASREASVRWGWATAALAAVLVPLLMWLPGTNGGLAFADVQRFFTDFETMSARMTTTMGEQTIMEMDIRVDENDRARLDAGSGFSYVIDPNRSQMLQLFHGRKQAALIALNEPEAVDEIAAMDWLDEIREFQGQAELLPGAITIRGQQARAFSLNTSGLEMTLWASESGEPMRLEMSSSEPAGPQAVKIRIDFEFDRVLEDSLFSLTPPADYRLLGDSGSD